MAISPLQIPQLGAVSGGMDFTPLANLGKVYEEARVKRGLEDALSGGVNAADPQSLAQLSARVMPFNPNLGMSLAQLGTAAANRQQDLARQAQQDAESKRRFELTYGLQARAADRADVQKPLFKEVTGADGQPTIVAIDPNTMSAKPVYGNQPAAGGGNPFGSGKFNNEQGKAAGFTDRMLQSESIMSGVDGGKGVEAAGADVAQTVKSRVPLVGNYLVSEDRQKYEQAKRDFINAQLRRESGAAISPSEFENADKQYFPVPGDSEATIRQKAANRRAAIEAMGREGGPSYRPKTIYGDKGLTRIDGMVNDPSQGNLTGGPPPPPKVGQLVGGYRYKGGDPGDPTSWVKASQ